MVKEVIDRVNLMIMTQGSRRVSKENLEFLFDKYELSAEDRQQVLDFCRDGKIEIFTEAEEETAAGAAAESGADSAAEKKPAGGSRDAETEKSAGEKKKGGFFSRLFGR